MYQHEPEDISEIDPLSRFTRATLYEGDVYAAWHAAVYVEKFELSSGEVVDEIPLGDWDDWVQGVSMTPSGVHIMNHHSDEPGGTRIARFDPDTGSLLGEVYLVRPDPPFLLSLHGLVCEELDR